MASFCPRILLILSLISFGRSALSASNLLIDSLTAALMTQQSSALPEKVLPNYYLLTLEYRKTEDWQKAIKIAREGLAYGEDKETLYLRGDLLAQVGYCLIRLTKYDQALDVFKKVQQIPDEGFKFISVDQIYTDLATIYKGKGDYQKAYQYYFKVLRIQESKKDSMDIAKTLYGIGSLMYYQENYTEALSYYKRSQEICELLDNPRGIYSSLGGIASVYIAQKQYDKALEYNIRSLELARQLNVKSAIGYGLQNIGSCYNGLQQHNKAKDYIEQAIQIKKSIGDDWGLIGCYLTLGESHFMLGNYNDAISIFDKAMVIAEKSDSKPRILNLYSSYATVYEKAGNLKSANEYLRKYINLKDTLINESSMREMGNTKSDYEVQKREDEIALLTSQKALLEQEKKIKSLYYYLMGASLVFMLTLTLIWFSRFSMQKRLVGLLEEKNDQIHIQNKQLESSNEDLQQFAYVASHDLKEPLRMISSYTTLLKKRYHHLFDDQAEEFMYYVVDAVDRMQTLLDDLLAYSRVETRGGNQQWMESTDAVAIVAANLRMAIAEKNVKLTIHYDQLPKILADRSQMVQLFQNLVSNAIKFVDTDAPLVEIGCVEKKGEKAFFVKDNGIGIDEKFKEKIFEMFHRLHTREEFEGTGIGLATCKRIVDRHGGMLWVESEKGKGSTFFFTFPKKSFAPSDLQKEPVAVN